MKFEENFPSLQPFHKDWTEYTKDEVKHLVSIQQVQETCLDKAKVREAIRHLEGLMIVTAIEFGQVNEGAERHNKAIRMCQRRLEKELKL